MGTIFVKSAFNASKKVFKREKLIEVQLRVIFDQWSKLHLGLDVRPEIPILKGLY